MVEPYMRYTLLSSILFGIIDSDFLSFWSGWVHNGTVLKQAKCDIGQILSELGH